jgi:hypothetical protein
VKFVLLFLVLALQVGPMSLIAEQPARNSNLNSGEASSSDGSAVVIPQQSHPEAVLHPFTLGATMESVSTLGAQFQIATNLNRRMNLRNNFDLFLWHKWITYEGFTAPVAINMGSINTSLDFYPFPNHGLRFSPGVLFHTSPGTSRVAVAPVKGGSFTLNGHTYYSIYTPCPNCGPMDPAPGPEPVSTIQGLQLRNTAFTMTTGWGNMIPRKKAGPWSFPVELGVAFLGSPTVKTLFTQGQICDAQGHNCQDAATNSQFQSDLRAEFGAYKNHLDLLKTYPIISFGLAYRWSSRTAVSDWK